MKICLNNSETCKHFTDVTVLGFQRKVWNIWQYILSLIFLLIMSLWSLHWWWTATFKDSGANDSEASILPHCLHGFHNIACYVRRNKAYLVQTVFIMQFFLTWSALLLLQFCHRKLRHATQSNTPVTTMNYVEYKMTLANAPCLLAP